MARKLELKKKTFKPFKPTVVARRRMQLPTFNRIAILAVFNGHPFGEELCAREVADELDVTYTDVHAILRALYDKNWLARSERQAGYTDRGSSRVFYSLTRTGLAHAKEFCSALVDPKAAFTQLRFSYDDDAKLARQRGASGARDAGQREAKSPKARAS